MADIDDYESLPDDTPFHVTAAAGALAGIAEHVALFPVDSVKTRMQSLTCEKQHRMGIFKMLTTMMREEGFFRPIRGVNAMAAGAGPAHAMYFTCLEYGKTLNEKSTLIPASVGDGVSAVFATLLHDAVMTPADVVKQRMQMCCSPYTSCTSCAWSVFKTEGIGAFYRSYTTALVMNIPFQVATVMTYRFSQRQLNPSREYNPTIHFLAGGLAGSVASVVTMPFDVCKTLLNTQEANVLTKLRAQEVKGFFNAGKVIYQLAGFRGFFHGVSARVLYQAPSTAIAWSVYEFFKYYLNLSPKNDRGDDRYETLSESSPGYAHPSLDQIGSRVGHLSASGSVGPGLSEAAKTLMRPDEKSVVAIS